MTVRLPTADEINVYNSLDEQWALRNFLGKTLEEAEALFRGNRLHYLGDSLWMGPKAFCFYVPAAVRFIQSDDTTGDPATVSYFHSVLEWRLQNDRAQIASVIPLLREAVSYILDHWERFDVEPAIFGDLKERYIALRKRLDDQPF
jgi:hypothetical protein